MDLVSVIIPYYKKRKFILETVYSAVNQSYKNLEIIIIYDDNNKTDLDFIREIANKDNRIKIIENRRKWELEFLEILVFQSQRANTSLS